MFSATLAAALGGTYFGQIIPGFWGLIPQVLAGLLVNVSSDYVEPLSAELLEQLKNKDPDLLNHDLQKILVQSLLQSCQSIAITYSKEFDKELDEKSRDFLTALKKKFKDEFSSDNGRRVNEKELRGALYKPRDKEDQKYLAGPPTANILLTFLNKELEKQKLPGTFRKHFETNFFKLLQLHFCEGIKNKKNTEARQAFNQMLAEETLAGVNKIIAYQKKHEKDKLETKNSAWLAKVGKLPPAKISQLEALVKEISNTRVLEIKYDEMLDKRLDELFNQYQVLHEDVLIIKSNVQYIKGWLLNHLKIAYTLALISVVLSVALVVRSISLPFNVTFTIQPQRSLNIANSYPPLKYPAKLSLYLNKEIQGEVTFDNKAIFADLDAKFLNEKVAVKLTDKYWEATVDSITLQAGVSAIPTRPNNVWSVLEGDVKYFNGEKINSIAEIHINSDTIIYTDTAGRFSIKLPIAMRREQHEISVYVNGKIFATDKANPITFNKIRSPQAAIK